MKNGWYEDEYGYLSHYINDVYHNENCPSVIWKDGTKNWYQNDNRHRLDGPSVEYSNGYKLWYYQGEEIKCKSQQEFERIIKLKLFW